MNNLNPEQVTAYLRRLGVNAPGPPTPETLNTLHVAHQERIPFENLDIHLGRPIRLELPSVYGKIVENGRGWFPVGRSAVPAPFRLVFTSATTEGGISHDPAS